MIVKVDAYNIYIYNNYLYIYIIIIITIIIIVIPVCIFGVFNRRTSGQAGLGNFYIQQNRAKA